MKQLSIFFLTIVILFFTSCTKNEVTKITISDNEITLLLGEKDSLFANTEYTGDIIPSTTWTSSNTSVVKVSQGEVEAIAKGTAVITAQAGNKTATCNIIVENEIKPTLVKGELWFWGDIYQTGFSNNFTVCIASSGINLDNLTGDGEFMYIEFNTDTLIKNNIPSGTYEIAETFRSGTMVAGWVDEDDFPWGTWYFGKTYNDVVSGIVVVTNSNNIYNIKYNLVDYYGNNISGIYNGSLTYFDYTVNFAPKMIKNKFNIANDHLSLISKKLRKI